jgi:nitrogen fixation protein NifB
MSFAVHMLQYCTAKPSRLTLLEMYNSFFCHYSDPKRGKTMTNISLEEQRVLQTLMNTITPHQVIHLPVAPQVTARTRFGSGDPNKTSFMQPEDALSYLDATIQEKGSEVKMAAITGPGDPLAVPDTTLKTLDLIKKQFPDLQLGIKTLGIGGDRFAKDLASAGLSYVEVEVNGVQHEVLEKIYAWIRPGQKTLKIEDGVALLIKEQQFCVPAFKFYELKVLITSTLFPGHNFDQVQLISRKMMEMGADGIAISPYIPEIDAEVTLPVPDCKSMEEAFQGAEKHLPLFTSLFSQPQSITQKGTSNLPSPKGKRTKVAVASSNGMDIDLHLGHARQVLIYGAREDGLHCLLEARPTPKAGTGKSRWQELGATLNDCFVLLAAHAGSSPREVLSTTGLPTILTDENVEGTVDVLFTGNRKKGKKKQ